MKKEIIKFILYLILLTQLLITTKIRKISKRLENQKYNNTPNNTNLTKIKNDIDNKINKQNIIDNEKYLQYQSYFCENQLVFKNILLEEMIKLVKINIKNTKFDMYVYKNDDNVSKRILKNGYWELEETDNLLSALLFYTKKKNIEKKDAYILDIGANIGWYSMFFGNNGFNIVSFEPSKRNYYILLKNYCLNQDNNMRIINKGLDVEEKNAILYHPFENLGNAIIFHNNFQKNKNNYLKEEIKLTKLNNYFEFFKNKNLALIKLDIEGSEGKAIQGGIDFIIKFHIPFIFMEFNPTRLKKQGTEPKEFLEIFENNGYKISDRNFLSKKYVSINDLLKRRFINIYISYIKFID